MLEGKTPKIRVLVRKRPMNKKQLARGQTDIVLIEKDQTVIVRQQKLKVDLTPYIDQYKYNFDGAYDQFATNEFIYETSVRPLVDCAFDGAKVTCFAYGQTGSGKTYTMLGNGSNVRGLYILASEDIFKIQKTRNDLEIWISFYEIYCGKLYDLLNEKNILFAREDSRNNINIVGLSETKINNGNQLMEYISYGTSVRVTSQNGTNNDSSRSHAILQICLKKKNKLHGKISFIDLAGSQRAADHADQLEKQTKIDGAQINKSLLALKECIRALDQNKNHTPFRGSKLTMVLKDSFTGYCRTVMIGNIAPNSSSSQNTLNTLKYADRVKQLKKARELELMGGGDKFDQLEKELMLPRNGMNLKPKQQIIKSQDFEQQRQNTKSLGNRNIMIPSKPKNIPVMPKMAQKNSKTKANEIQSIISAVNNANNIISANISNVMQSYNSNNPNPINRIENNYLERQLPIQQQELDITQISQKHDECVQLVLEEEENLIKQHEKHIKQMIEITKQEMKLRDEADKVGSNINSFLDNLDELLQQKVNSINNVRNRIHQLKQHVKQQKRIEQQYAQLQKQLYQQQEQCLMDDDEELFV